MDSAEFHALVYQVIRQIPEGRVTSYGHVAKLVGMPHHARHVGQALKYLAPGTEVPWQRVLSSSGKISSRGPGTEGAARQRDALIAEGVEVRENRDGGWSVRWSECGWFPEQVNLDLENQNLIPQDDLVEPGEGEDVQAPSSTQPGNDGGELDLGQSES